MSAVSGDHVLSSPLALPGWVEFNAWRHHLEPASFHADLAGGGRVEVILYADRRGRIIMPRGTPYVAFTFEAVRDSPASRTAAWIEAVDAVLDEFDRRGVVNQVHLPPELEDARPFTWRGYLVGTRYTYLLDLPLALDRLSTRARADIRRSQRRGYAVERTDDIDAVLACLAQTEDRKAFSHGLTREHLEAAVDHMGLGNLRMYAAFGVDRVPLSAIAVLHAPGTRALGWLSGSTRAGIQGRAGLSLWAAAFDDLANAGATGIDMCGANIAAVASYKSHWGPRLVPIYDVRRFTLRALARFGLDWRDASRMRREITRQRRVPDRSGEALPDR